MLSLNFQFEFFNDILNREIENRIFRDVINGKIYTETWKIDRYTPYFHKIVDVNGERCYLTLYPFDEFSSIRGKSVTVEVNENCCGFKNEKAKLILNKYTATI